MPMPQNPFGSPAVSDLGLGDMLGMQVKDETEEMRKKRLLQMQQQRGGMLPGNAASMLGLGSGAALGGLGSVGFGGR